MSEADHRTKAVLDRVRTEAVLTRLEEANRRIQQLEQSERTLNLEVTRLRSVANHLAFMAIERTQGVELWPAQQINTSFRSFSIVQRREAWLKAITRVGASGALFGLYPHDGGVDPFTILVRGSGGLGDMIYLSTMLRALWKRFAQPRIVVLHEHPDAAEVFGNNPYVLAVLSLQGERHQQFLTTAASIDIFDLIVDVRYAVTYAVPPLSRAPIEFLLSAHTRAVQWQKFVRRDWPFLNNELARECLRFGMSKFDLLGYTANLSIDSSQVGVFFPDLTVTPEVLAALKKPYITLHHGADRYMSGRGGIQTKNLPDHTWATVSSLCAGAGYSTVQLGHEHENVIAGVQMDLRGATSLSQTALILKHASVHIDTEGGLVHLARSMGTASVVAFGPTPVSFFGYPGNINIAPRECGECWWTARDWALKCPLGMASPACMKSHSATEIASAALNLARGRKVIELCDLRVVRSLTPTAWRKSIVDFIPEHCQSADEGAIVATSGVIGDFAELDACHRTKLTGFISGAEFASAKRSSFPVDINPFSHLHIPAGSSIFAWAFVDLQGLPAADAAWLFSDAARIVRPGGTVLVRSGATDFQTLFESWPVIHNLSTTRLGASREMKVDCECLARIDVLPEDKAGSRSATSETARL